MPILTELNLYPIKSCAGISLRSATFTPAGLMSEFIYDREWMVVDAAGNFLTQREFPAMALIKPRLKSETLEISAPGMMKLEIPLDLADPDEAPTLEVTLWEHKIKAYDCDALVATWFSNAVGTPCRLVRFHPNAERKANEKWVGKIEANVLFADGYPMLLISEASLADLNGKLAAAGREALPMDRFRPNIVIGGTDAFDEDFAATIRMGDVVLKPVKPCPRCPIPAVDQATGVVGPDPMDILQTYRTSKKLDGAVAFGQNVVLLDGEGTVLRVGQEVDVRLAF